MAKYKIYNGDKNKWKVVLVKTLDGTEPIIYRLVNLATFEIVEVPAYRLLDDFVLNRGNIIVNIRFKHNKVVIIDENGYDNADECILVDFEDNDIESIYEWAISHGELGQEVINNFDAQKNNRSTRNIRINDKEKIVWTCGRGHSIKCGFATYYSLKAGCPICDAVRDGNRVSLKYWGDITDNKKIVRYFDQSPYNDSYSSEIPFDSKSKIFFEGDNEEFSEMRLYDVTVKGIKPFEVKKEIVNLTRKNQKRRKDK